MSGGIHIRHIAIPPSAPHRFRGRGGVRAWPAGGAGQWWPEGSRRRAIGLLVAEVWRGVLTRRESKAARIMALVWSTALLWHACGCVVVMDADM